MPETVHCSQCGKSFRVKDFADQMRKLRHHYRTEHPRLWRRSVKKSVEKRKKK